ncbi:hypothetical protein HZB00_03995 [Candidatus Woesearchaeota archaeon]|nr:hypothetical protein [Candidatus Woesearchaeota archaeon]
MDITTISQTPITTAELKQKLDQLKQERKELNFRAAKVYEQLVDQELPAAEKIQELKQKVTELNVPRLRDKHIIKIIDVMPENVDVLKVLFSGENITVKAEDLKKIVDTIHS